MSLLILTVTLRGYLIRIAYCLFFSFTSLMSLGNQEAPRSILASGTSFREDLVMKFNISTAILPLLLIQEEHLSVNGEKMCAKYWLPASWRLAQEQCG